MSHDDPLASRRRILQLALGVIWLLDAALQFQPYMFTRAFPQQVLAPVGPGNPWWIADPVHWAATLAATHVAVVNAGFATAQLLIALGLFTKPTVRIALAGSIAWALGVWWMGEGLGGMLAGPQSPVMGAPGAAVIYALISILLWPRNDDEPAGSSVATSGPLRAFGARVAWMALWGCLAVETLQAANRAPSGLHDLVAGMADGEPRWLRSLNDAAAGGLAHHGTEVSIALAIGFGLIALAVAARDSFLRIALVVASVAALAIWVVAQDFGGIATGTATDPNTGPLLVLLAAVFWPARRTVPRVAAQAAPAHKDTRLVGRAGLEPAAKGL